MTENEQKSQIHKIKVIILDPNQHDNDYIASYLEKFDDIDVVQQFNLGENALSKCDELNVDVVILARNLVGINDITFVDRYFKNCPLCQFISIINCGEPLWYEHFQRAGGRYYVYKSHVEELLYQKIKDAYAPIASYKRGLNSNE